jgi:hypothetical protein
MFFRVDTRLLGSAATGARNSAEHGACEAAFFASKLNGGSVSAHEIDRMAMRVSWKCLGNVRDGRCYFTGFHRVILTSDGEKLLERQIYSH